MWRTEGSEMNEVVNKKLNTKIFRGSPRQRQQMLMNLQTIDKTYGE